MSEWPKKVDRGNCLAPTPTPKQKTERYKDQIRGHAAKIRSQKATILVLDWSIEIMRDTANKAMAESAQAKSQRRIIENAVRAVVKSGGLACECRKFDCDICCLKSIAHIGPEWTK